MDIISGAVLGGIGWLGVLAKSYYTDMAKLAIERSKQEQENEQRRIEKNEKYFEILLQNLLCLVGEEKDTRLQIAQETNDTLRRMIISNNQIHDEKKSLISNIRAAYSSAPTTIWDGGDRRT